MTSISSESAVKIDDVMITRDLAARPCPPPDFEGMTKVIALLARQIADGSDTGLQAMVDAALRLCRAGSAGLSILNAAENEFRWVAISGQLKPHAGKTIRRSSPSGIVTDRWTPELFYRIERHFTWMSDIKPPVFEQLMLPVQGGEVMGVIWVAGHDEQTHFTNEDLRILTSLSHFTSLMLLAQTARQKAEIARVLRIQVEEKERVAQALLVAHAEAEEGIRVRTAEIQEVNNRLQTEMVERAVAEREKQLALEREQNANRAKDRFLAILSHELRTPLSPVLMTVTAMETDPSLPEALRADVIMIRRNIELEAKLIDDLLDLSRVSSGKLRLQLQLTRVHDLLKHIVRNAKSDLAGKSLTIQTEYGATNDLVNADPARLQQVFWNLLRNATKFTLDGGEISIRTWDGDDATIFIEVRDNGVGISAEVLPRLFHAFEQGDSTIASQFGGLGLGLSISKTLLDMHGGTIHIGSAGLGKGTTLTVTLPVCDPTAAHVEEEEKVTAAGHQENVRLLLVEDHVDTSRVLGRLLERGGCIVEIARTVEAALRLAATKSFDVMVSDIGLPDGTGYELMHQVKERYALPGIALSGYGMEEDICKSLEAGFTDHLVKPVTIRQLRDAIQRVLATKGASEPC